MGKQYFFFGHAYQDDDGHQRITKAEDMVVTGGTKETHEHTVEKLIKVKEKLKGKNITSELFTKTVQEVTEKISPPPTTNRIKSYEQN